MKMLFFPLLLALLLASCESSVLEQVTYNINEPVFMDLGTFRSSVKISAAADEITGHGKISFFAGYLYMSEPDKGIHIIDNRNPAHPSLTGYIELPGNSDLSLRNNILYADSYIDLVWFDVSDPAHPVLKGRLENAFPEALPPTENTSGIDYEMCFGENRPEGVIVGWKEAERVESVENYTGGWFWNWGWVQGNLYNDGNAGQQATGNSVNGSMSRFTVYSDYLYTVVQNEMSVFDLSLPVPEKSKSLYVGGNVETIFNYEDHMFMGTPTGLLIYSVEDPLSPVFKSSIEHVFGCDPVVVDDDLAYVTIRSGSGCGQTANQLLVIDVHDKSEPEQIAAYTMTGPKGLGVDGKMLFLCDDGLKIFRTDDPLKIDDNLLVHYKGMDGYDVIPFDHVLMMIADDGIHQYDYSDINKIAQISYLPFETR